VDSLPPEREEAKPVAAADRRFQRSLAALRENRLVVAEELVGQFLEAYPDDVNGLRLLGDTLLRQNRLAEAEGVLARCLALAPGYVPAGQACVRALLGQHKIAEAQARIDALLAEHPGDPECHTLKALAHTLAGDYGQAVAEYERVLASSPEVPAPWMAHAAALRTMGRSEDGVAAYRNVVARFPYWGEAWWRLADFKIFRFTAAEIEAMRTAIVHPELEDDSKIYFHFALGKALEDEALYAESFDHYREANALRRATMQYSAELTTAFVSNSAALFTGDFFAARAGFGCKAPDPIFIVGMPRSGSTLVEQMLANHSMIETVGDLRIVPRLVSERVGRKRLLDSVIDYPESLRSLTGDQLAALGTEYLRLASPQRRFGRPYFVDKFPDNCGHLGLIHLMFPNAKIVDVRRHPMACCFSCFKQVFPPGQHFSYSQTDLGRYYLDYVRHMAHFDEVLPGRIHRVFYEDLVAEPEAEARRLFEYLNLPFEEPCLRYYETDRAMGSSSSEQVRRPIFKDGMDHWRNFEQWLAPLKKALGAVGEAYPEVPDFRRPS